MNELLSTQNPRVLQAVLDKWQELSWAMDDKRMWEAASLVLNGGRSLPPAITASARQKVQQPFTAVPVGGTPMLGVPQGVAPAAAPIGVR